MKRIGRWTYDSRIGWRLDGSDLVIDSQTQYIAHWPREWVVMSGPKKGNVIDQYMTGAMAFVEEHEAEYRPRRVQCRHLDYLRDSAQS